MSTAGKVLVFLTLPLILLWIVLMAGIARYNYLGSLAVHDLQQEQAKKGEEINATRAATTALKDDLNILQVATSREMAVIQDKKYSVQKQLSDATATATGAAIDLEYQQKAQKTAELNRDHRIAEKNQTQTELAAAEEEVERLKQVDRDQRVQLKKLRDEFSKIYKDNKLKVISRGQ